MAQVHLQHKLFIAVVALVPKGALRRIASWHPSPIMTELATIPPGSPSIPPPIGSKPVKLRKPTKRLRQAINLILSGECKTQKAAAERMKLTPTHLSRMLSEPHVLAYMEQQTRVTLARSQMPAAATLVKLLDQAASEHVQKDVAIHLLNIAGHKPASDAQVNVNIDIKAGYVIDLTEGQRAPMIDVSPKE